VEKPNSVIVYGYNKYLLEQSTRQIGSTSAISSYIQLYEERVSHRRTRQVTVCVILFMLIFNVNMLM